MSEFEKTHLNGGIPVKVKGLLSVLVRSRPQRHHHQVHPHCYVVAPNSDTCKQAHIFNTSITFQVCQLFWMLMTGCRCMVHLLPQCDGWHYHPHAVPQSRRHQWLERSRHGRNSPECTTRHWKPITQERKWPFWQFVKWNTPTSESRELLFPLKKTQNNYVWGLRVLFTSPRLRKATE